jgi:hypothetical protein
VDDWLIALVSGLIGFIAALAIEEIRRHRDEKDRDFMFINMFSEEMRINLVVIEDNIQLFLNELQSVDEKKFIIIPYVKFHTESYDIMKTHIPKVIQNNPALMIMIMDNLRDLNYFNDMTGIQMTHKTLSLSNKLEVIRKGNQYLLEYCHRIKNNSEDIRKALRNIKIKHYS